MDSSKVLVASKIFDAINKTYSIDTISIEEISNMLEYPPDSKLGDLAFPCFKLSKVLRSSPMKIADDIKNSISFDNSDISKLEVAGGYLNFFISPNFYAKVLSNIIDLGDDYGKSTEGNGKTVVLDYSSPNVAKPFHIGHLGTTVIGHSLKMIHEFLGYKCIGINYLGDWGTQFGKLITAYNLWGDDSKIEKDGVDELVNLYVRINNEIKDEEEKGITTLADKSREEFHKLELGDENNLKLWKWFIELSLKEYNKTYKQLGIDFDSYKGESFYTDKMPKQVELLREKGLLKLDDGASIVDLSEYNMPPCLILKKDGSTLYPTRDIAAAVYRKNEYKFDKAIYVTSSAQSLHFAQWFKVVELMGYDWYDQLVHVPYGTVSINGSKLATRTGNVILLRDLFETAITKVKEIIETKNPNLENKDEVSEAVGVGAIIFHYLSNSRIKDINFVIDDALNFDGNTGPYCQYTYARCCSILEKAGSVPSYSSNYTPNDSEIALIKTLSLFSDKVHDAAKEYEPMIITRFILDIAAGFNKFYHDCPINNTDNENEKAFRLNLTNATKTVLGNAFKLICLRKTNKI